jgi:fibronectin type 3 domain-containing protein
MIKKTAFICVAFALLTIVGCGEGPPHEPSNLSINSTSPITLVWDNVYVATSYNIYRGTASGDLSTKTLLASNVANGNASPVTTYTDTSAIAGTTYYYQITSMNVDKESSPSNEVHATP